jgi:hypothetical protein
MTSVRDLRPTDVVALAAFEARAGANQACTRERLQGAGKGPRFVNALVEPWLPAESRRTVVAADGLAIRGLASARQRRNATAWEVDWLMVNEAAAEHTDVAVALLEQIAARCGDAGAHRVFLRVPRGCGLVEAARRASFWPYVSETVFVRTAERAADDTPSPETVRPRAKQDDLPLFRLYSAVVPSAVRSAEGMTLDEWSASQEATPGSRKDFVRCHQEGVDGWVWVARSGSACQISLISAHDDETTVNTLVRHALGQCPRRGAVAALVPDFQSGLQFALRADWDFQEVAHYQTLIRRLPVRVAQPAFVPARA